MKKEQRPDKRIHIRKKVAGGTTGAMLGAVVGGPVGALVGGVIGSMVGDAAEKGKFQELAAADKKSVRKPAAKVKTVAKRVAKNVKPAGKSLRGRKGRKTQPKSKSKRGS